MSIVSGSGKGKIHRVELLDAPMQWRNYAACGRMNLGKLRFVQADWPLLRQTALSDQRRAIMPEGVIERDLCRVCWRLPVESL